MLNSNRPKKRAPVDFWTYVRTHRVARVELCGMQNNIHVILGSGGGIGRPLAQALASYAQHVRCCSRTPHPLPEHASTQYEHQVTDVTKADQVARACTGAAVVYLCVGLPYETKVWQREWPVLIDRVIAACAKTGAKLAFFDNVYAYAPSSYAAMDETAPLDPPSQKGAVRATMLNKLWTAHREGRCEVTVGRAADFYGPGLTASLLGHLVIDRLVAGKAAQWLGDPDVPHSFTFTPDAGKHFALLANQDQAYGQSWHLPTASNPWTIREWVAALAEQVGCKPRLQVIPRPLYWLLSRVTPQLRELYDVRHQLDGPYVFHSRRFEETFGVRPTSYAEGLASVLADAVARSTKGSEDSVSYQASVG